MCKSFIEYITALGHWGWVVLMDILSGFAGAYLDISGTWGFPTWLWLSLLGIGLVIVPFIAFHKVRVKRDEFRKQLDDKAKRREIRETLGSFLYEGYDLRVKCANEKEQPPTKDIEDFAGRLESYLRENLGEAYIARLVSAAGLPIGVTSITSKEHRNLWSRLGIWTARLDQFISELKE